MSTHPPRSPDGWPSYRSPHRRRADEQAHAAPSIAPPTLDHPLVPAGPPELVQTQAGLLSLVELLRAEGRFGYDTEFIGEDSFYPRFCVIQVSTPRAVHLIDALATDGGRPLDLLPFWGLIADPGVEVVVHAGLQDLEPVHRHTRRPPANVFDMQVAAGFIGLPYPASLGKLVLGLTGAELGTSSKFSQWDRRPLTAVQQAYAANDVRYLLLLRERVGERLAELGHTDKAQAEFEAFSDPSTYRTDPLAMKLKAKGGNGLKRREQAVMNALLRWRAREAERRNVPMRALVDDQVLVELAKNPVAAEADVRSFRGLPWPVKEAYAQELVSLTAEALAGPLPRRARSYKPLSDAGLALLDRLWLACQSACEAASIAPSIALTKRELIAVVRAHQAGKEPTGEESRLLRGWRGEVLGPVIRSVLGGARGADPAAG